MGGPTVRLKQKLGGLSDEDRCSSAGLQPRLLGFSPALWGFSLAASRRAQALKASTTYPAQSPR